MLPEILTSLAMKVNGTRKMSFATGAETYPFLEHVPQDPLLLYLHIPFCQTLCPYCSFNRYPFEQDLAARYFGALRRELAIYHDKGFSFRHMYIGGGTPTIDMAELEKTIDCVRRLFPVEEISIETNPDHLVPDTLERLRDRGVGRLSVGVQTFDDGILRQMERYDKYGSGDRIAERIRPVRSFFRTLNIDMMFNYPGQTPAMVEKDLDTILELEPDQVTFYPFIGSTLPGSGAPRHQGLRQERDCYRRISERLGGSYTPETVWCFSRQPDLIDEYIVDHAQYVGVGSGAFGYLNGTVYANAFSLERYLAALQEDRLPVIAVREMSRRERMQYDFLMQLFRKRLDIPRFRDKYRNFYRHLWKELLFFSCLGGTRAGKNSVRLTSRGMYYWVIMMREFFTGVNNLRQYCRARNY